jgi:hypothetical protein
MTTRHSRLTLALRIRRSIVLGLAGSAEVELYPEHPGPGAGSRTPPPPSPAESRSNAAGSDTYGQDALAALACSPRGLSYDAYEGQARERPMQNGR